MPKEEIVRFKRFRIKCLEFQIVCVGKPITKLVLGRLLCLEASNKERNQRSRI